MLRALFKLILLITATTALSAASTPKVTVKADSTNLLIGDQSGITIQFLLDSTYKAYWPSIPDTIGILEVVNRSGFDTTRNGSNHLISYKLIVTSFDTGRIEFPSYSFSYEKPEFDEPYPLSSEPVMFDFKTIIPDTTQPIKEIKGQYEEPWTIREILDEIAFWLMIAIIIYYSNALLGIIIVLIYGRKKGIKEPEPAFDPLIPPHIWAFEALKKLDAEKLWQKGHVKKYYIRLSEIFRAYIERRMGINALEMTSREIYNSLRNWGMENELLENTLRMLSISDLAKFAKQEPLPDENSFVMKHAFTFVELTRPLDKQEDSKAEVKNG